MAKAFSTIAWSTYFAIAVKYFVHFIAGVIYWGIYALEGMSPYLYSFIVNGGAGLATFVVVGIVIGFIVYKSPRLLFHEGLIVVRE